MSNPSPEWIASRINADPPDWSEEKHALITELLEIPGLIYVDPKQTEDQLRNLLAEIKGA